MNQHEIELQLENGLIGLEQFETVITPMHILQLRTLLMCKAGTVEPADFILFEKRVHELKKLLNSISLGLEAKQILNKTDSPIPRFAPVLRLPDPEDEGFFDEDESILDQFEADLPSITTEVVCGFCGQMTNIYDAENLGGVWWCHCDDMIPEE